MKRSFLFVLLSVLVSCKLTCQSPVTLTYNCSGAPQTFVVPTCVTSITIEAWGAGGGGGGWDTYGGSAGGGGSYINSVLSVTPGQVLTVITGCGGLPGGACQAGSGFGSGGYGLGFGGDGGNPGVQGCSGPGGGGGGGTGILNGGTILAVAGGGGGGGGGGNYGGGADGGGGDQNGNSAPGASGGLLAASGSTNGAAGIMTNGDGAGGGGGGGGLSGGGGGNVPGTDYGGAGGAGGTSLGTTIMNGNIITPGNSGSANLCAGCAAGGSGSPPGGTAAAGGNGVLLLTYINITQPVVSANASSNPICAGNPVTLTGSGATTYAWTGGVTDGVPFTPGSTATYTVTGNTLGCTGTAVITVTVNSLPTINVNSGSICSGQSMALTANGAVSYNWAPSTGLSGTTSSVVIANPSSTTVYTVTGTDANSCSSSGTSTLTVNALPIITVNSAAICAGQQTAALTANGASSYNWSPATGLNTTNGANVSANPSSTTVYTITGTDVNTCTSTATSTVTVNALPTVTVSSGSICSGASVTITAGGASTYSWSPGTNLSSTTGPTVTANPPSLTIYTVTGTDINSCTNIATTTVTVNSPPVVTVNSAAICIGQQSATLTANGANTYLWSPASGLSSAAAAVVTATPASTTVYTVTGTAVNGCTNSAVSTVTVNSLPFVSVNSSTICVGQQTANLTANGATTYTWFPAASLSSSSGSVNSANPSSTTVYTIAGTDGNSCINATTATVIVNPVPVLTVNSASICAGQQTAALTANGAATYTWLPVAGLSSSSGSNVLANPASTTIYTIVGTDVNNCTNTITSTITVNPLPTITVNSGTMCVGQQTVSLTAGGASTYSWLPAAGLSSTSGANVSANPGSSTVYTVSATDVNTCTTTATSTITVYSLPTITVNSAAICKTQQTATLNATGAVNYVWSPSSGLSSTSGSSVVANPSSSSSYTIAGTDANSCTNTAVTSVTVNPIPVITVNSTTICLEQSANLVANGASAYTWSPTSGLSSNNGSNVSANPVSTTVYSVSGTDVNTCTNIATSTVVVNPLPLVVVNSSLICVGQQTAVLNALGAINYTWAPAIGLNATTGNNVMASPIVTTIYTVTGTDNANCSGTSTSTVTVKPLPAPVISPLDMAGCEPLCINFAELSNTAGTYDWTFGDGMTGVTGTPSHCYNQSGDFVVRVKLTDAFGCKDSSATNVTVYPTPVADFVYAPLKPHIYADDQVTFTNASYGANIVSYNWYFITPAVVLSTEQNPVINYTKAGDYTSILLVTSDHGCIDTISHPIQVSDDFNIFIPNAFTPNGDGINETFQPKGLGFSKYHMRIFDRWGELIYETDELGNGWDGTFTKKSKDILPNDVYVYIIHVVTIYGESKDIVGHVTLMK